MARAMEEALAVAGGLDHRSRGPIRPRGSRPRDAPTARAADCASCTTACTSTRSGGAPDRQRPGRVAAVPVENAAEVQHERVAVFDDALGGLVMRRGRVRPGSDDREVDPVVAAREQQLSRAPPRSHRSWRPANRRVRRSCQRRVGGLAARPSASSSAASLRARSAPTTARADLQEALGRAGLHARAGASPRCGPRPRSGRRRQPAGDDGVRILAVSPSHDLEPAGARLPRARADARASARAGAVPRPGPAPAASPARAASARSRSDRRGRATAATISA